MILPEHLWLFETTRPDGGKEPVCVTTPSECVRLEDSPRHRYLGQYALVKGGPKKRKLRKKAKVMT